MEVFVHNLPAQGDLSDRGLWLQLRPFMLNLNIPDTSYDCEKTSKKRHGFITFLSEKDGQKFLDTHGEIRRPNGRATVSRLLILGASVMCKRSTSAPNAITLRVLSAQAEQARHPQQRPHATAAEKKPDSVGSSFRCRSMSCGYYKFAGDKLTFVPELTDNMESLVDFGKRHLTIQRNDDVLIHIPLNTIHEIVWSPSGSLTLTLTVVPLFLSAKSPGQDHKRSRLTALNQRHAEVVGMCLVYHFVVVPEQIHRKMQKLNDLGSLTVSRFDVPISSGPDFGQSERRLKAVLSAATAKSTLPFSLLIQLQALAYNAYLHPDTVAGLAQELCTIYRDTPITSATMQRLFQAIDWPTPNHHDPSEFEVPALIDYLVETERQIQDGKFVRDGLVNPGQNLTPVHRVVVTPTRITLHGPELENKNRVLRKFPNHHDYFIRVQFCDEDGQSLRFSSRTEFTNVYSRFKNFMINGIQVAGRTYSFLGWSHSSLRAHSMWFSAPFIDDNGHLQTHFSIISILGQFGEIFSPARCAARIGQAFSETPFAVPLAENNIRVFRIPDVKSPDSLRVFSDGVGTISEGAAAVIWQHLPRGKKQPTCFQIRYAGAKGMLSLDTRLDGKEIHLRPSMIKFESGETANLEICDMASQPIALYLNRQLVKILEDMGVPKSWFLRLQNDALKELRLIASSSYNMANFLKSQSVATAIKLHKVLLLADRLGLDYRTEPFLRRATDAVILRELRLLKHKARMFVPYGITLFGVMDETGFLGEDEVYVTFEAKSGSKTQRFKAPPRHLSPLLVTRSPALHPGDIQRAVNIVPPDDHPLRNLHNCIVFSARGYRDLPSQLSGGDLDGDIFNIIWDPEICNLPTLTISKAADYPRQGPLSIGRRVQTEDIADFFIDFIRTDHLGAIATRHMILADQLEHGTLEKECIAVAEMHSTAVDFSKTGIPADLRNLPRANKFRPDFLSPGPIVQIYNRSDIELEQFIDRTDEDDDKHELDAPNYKYYGSLKTLGTLYRAIDEKQIWKDDIQRPPKKSTQNFYDAFLDWATEECKELGCHGWKQQRSEEALRIRSAYEDAIVTTMYEFSEHPTLPITELEVFIGTIMNKTGSQTTRQRDRSRKLRDEYERISSWIASQIRPRTRDEDWLPKRLEILELCLACAYSQKESNGASRYSGRGAGRKDGSEVESFWLVAASAVIRELEFIKRSIAVDADLQVEIDMAQLAIASK